VPTRKIGKASVERIRVYARRHSLPLFEAARRAGLIEDLNKGATVAIARFVAMIDSIGESIQHPVEEIVGRILSETGYREVLENSESEEDEERLANLEEFLTAAREFDVKHPEGNALETFLEETSLVADTDAWEAENDKVALMTLHAAKGLEFPVVFVVACENGFLPHERNMHDDEKVEEERRLLFVGITRAREELQLSYAQYRSFRGQTTPTVPSPFLMELPRHEMAQSDSVASRRTTPEWNEGFEPNAHQGDEVFDFFDELANTNPTRQRGSDTNPTHQRGTDGSPKRQRGTTDDDFSQDEEDRPRPKRQQTAALTSGLVTAADLLAKQSRPRVSPHLFKHGMTVEHPQYGPGTIVALSGEGPKRNAVVRFFSDQAERSFRLAFSDLVPAEVG
jgi:DNA helicase-2/ATP-dependent DNA helicase PcrA